MKAISATARSAGLARSDASLARTGAASACSSMGSASVSGSNLNPLVGVADVAKEPLLSDVSEDEDEDDDNDSLEMIIGNLFLLGGVIVVVMSIGRTKVVGKTMILIFPAPMTLTEYLFVP